MKIIVDAMGGDNAPQAPVMGAIQANKEYGVGITLVGRGEDILKVLEENGIRELPAGVEIAHASELVEIMLEVAMNRSPTVKIGRDAEYPTGFVQQRFEKITSMHIEKVMDGIRENTTRVWNTKAYLMAALFNSVSTIDNHYAMLVNHDFHGGP